VQGSSGNRDASNQNSLRKNNPEKKKGESHDSKRGGRAEENWLGSGMRLGLAKVKGSVGRVIGEGKEGGLFGTRFGGTGVSQSSEGRALLEGGQAAGVTRKALTKNVMRCVILLP